MLAFFYASLTVRLVGTYGSQILTVFWAGGFSRSRLNSGLECGFRVPSGFRASFRAEGSRI